ncbi:amidase signature domain-containing protein [Exophiala viscosa]|uniref:Amidase signature domain-containing protein n=1 Tax=Exophiala viscosa TaxID=2486360 RepID=A0AAN6DZH1_9EURO|nr:amidase signature domain-containing protein [Exophiala viscosa]KAI1621678.1 amidase signature domain-containing protein [Exophiala viscosa]
MVARQFAVVQPKAVPKGTPEFEEKRSALLRTLEESFPTEYYLPSEIISNPPKDVSKIPSTCGLLTPEELEITEGYDAVGLAAAIAERKYTAVAVAKAFCKRAVIVHQLTCCLTQFFQEKALEQAAQLDEYLEKNGKTVGPLHGLPISVKEHMVLAGTYSSQGEFSTIVKDDKDSQMISIFRKAGAIFYCKTNQPQTIMHLETDSHWGRTLNPFNIDLSAGGSTGGEAALIAMKGSVLGIGTDIGGSVRGPSAFCGIYGFKPTSYTLPMKDFLASPFPAELNILCSTGPMCRTMKDMELFVKTILDAKPYLEDPRLIPIPWTGLKTPVEKLKIGIIANDGFIDPQPPVKRAIAWAKKTLSDPKYADILEVKDFTPYAAADAWKKIRRMYWPDGATGPIEAITSSGEPIHPLSEWIWKDAKPHGMQNATAVAYMRQERDNFRMAFAENWNAQDVDVVIGPAFVGPASAHDTAFYWTYTSLYNFVDYPGVVFPTPVTTEAGEKYADDYEPLSEECKHVKQLWEESNFEGAPIDLQINARKYHDNQLFGALAKLKDILSLP